MNRFSDTIANNIAVVSLMMTITLAFVGYVATYVNNRLVARKKDRLELVTKRLNEFYGPLYVAAEAGLIAYRALLTKLSKEKIFEEGEDMPQVVLDEWYVWAKAVFMPLDEVMERVIIEKAHLIIEERMPECLLQLVTHVAGFKVVLAKWDKHDFSENHSLIDFPKSLHDYVDRSYAELKHQQARLLESL